MSLMLFDMFIHDNTVTELWTFYQSPYTKSAIAEHSTCTLFILAACITKDQWRHFETSVFEVLWPLVSLTQVMQTYQLKWTKVTSCEIMSQIISMEFAVTVWAVNQQVCFVEKTKTLRARWMEWKCTLQCLPYIFKHYPSLYSRGHYESI